MTVDKLGKYISIQALYDYKPSSAKFVRTEKHISIQALYDYKLLPISRRHTPIEFQFKHCTIIRGEKSLQPYH